MPKKNDEQTATEKSPFEVGDEVAFQIKKQDFTGTIEKAYKNSFLIGFESSDPDIIDTYHNKTVINWQNLKMVKQGPREKKEEESAEDDK
ncbi:YkvS family protein [Fructilactobacillus hinvesii]|uniref:YkvS family protein n=1 Tax=Fructilactobacillus hinvesii TaxID=2940300 RepID=A0ABY5BTN9_9LACO|nr:DUF2187 family protein [Fructilactobacillus hinvesii]USS88495.1 YkvS family protein [Fructilactobacillus hinvesii]